MSATTCPAYVLTIFYCFPEGEVPLKGFSQEKPLFQLTHRTFIGKRFINLYFRQLNLSWQDLGFCSMVA